MRVRLLVRMLSLALLTLSCDGESSSPTDAQSGNDVLDMRSETDSTQPPDGTDTTPPSDTTDPGGSVDRPLDSDDDGVYDLNDAFPDDPAEHLDSDANGTGNHAQADEDNDGVDDALDELPFDASASTWPTVDEVEPNSASNGEGGSAMPIEAPTRIRGSHTWAQDFDSYVLDVPEGSAWTIGITSSWSGAPRIAVGIEWEDASAPTPLRLPTHYDPASLGFDHAITLLAGTSPLVFTPIQSRYDGSAEPATYEVTVFRDDDADGLPDANERALGLRTDTDDSDGDGILDTVELLLEDVDADGIPSWFDADADGNTLPDGVEGLGDADLDGLPDLIDLDNDNDGTSDLDELNALPTTAILPDLDQDGVPDLSDIDDDGDTLIDTEDPNPTTPAPRSTTASLSTATSEPLSGLTVTGWSRTGDTVSVSGQGLANATHITLASNPGVVANIAPSTSTDTSVTFDVPALPYHVFQLRVAVDDGLTGPLLLELGTPDAPILEPVNTTAPHAAATLLRLNGSNLQDLSHAEGTGGLRIPIQNSGADFVELDLDDRRIHTLRLVRFDGTTSNPISLRLSYDVQALWHNIPSGAPFVHTDLKFSSTLQDAGAPPAGSSQFGGISMITQAGMDVVTARYTSTGDVADEVPVLLALTFPGDTSVTIDMESTALALVVMGSTLGTPSTMQEYVFEKLKGTTEITTLAAALETALVASPSYLVEDFSTEVQSALEAAVATVLPIIKETLPPAVPPTGIVTPDSLLGIAVEEIAGDNVAVINSSSLFLSPRMVLVGSEDEEILSHVSSAFEPNVIGGAASLARYLPLAAYRNLRDVANPLPGPSGRDARLELITPGLIAAASLTGEEASVHKELLARTIAEKVIAPILTFLMGQALGDEVFIELVAKELAVQLTLLEGVSTSSDALSFAVNFLVNELESVGPITEYITSKGAAAIAKVLGKQLAKVTISSWLTAIDAGITATGIIQAVVQIVSTPARMDFNIDFTLEVEQVVPEYIHRSPKARKFLLFGRKLHAVYNTDGSLLYPIVQVRDTATQSVYAELPERIAPDGRAVHLTVPGTFLEEAVGPLELSVTTLDDETGETVRVTCPDQVTIASVFAVKKLSPSAGQPGDRITVQGTGFKVDDSVRVGFRNAEQGVTWAHVGQKTPESIEVTVPANVDALEGWEVFVQQGPAGAEKRSEPLVFHHAIDNLLRFHNVSVKYEEFRQASFPATGYASATFWLDPQGVARSWLCCCERSIYCPLPPIETYDFSPWAATWTLEGGTLVIDIHGLNCLDHAESIQRVRFPVAKDEDGLYQVSGQGVAELPCLAGEPYQDAVVPASWNRFP